MEVVTKIVNFDLYCKNCEHFKKESYEDPCHECLHTPARENSRKPLYFKENSQKKQRV